MKTDTNHSPFIDIAAKASISPQFFTPDEELSRTRGIAAMLLMAENQDERPIVADFAGIVELETIQW